MSRHFTSLCGWNVRNVLTISLVSTNTFVELLSLLEMFMVHKTIRLSKITKSFPLSILLVTLFFTTLENVRYLEEETMSYFGVTWFR